MDPDDAIRAEIRRDERRRLVVDLLCLIALNVLVWSGGACRHDRIVEHAVTVVPPPCLTRPAPLPPDAAPCSPAWATYYVALSAWVVETEASCSPKETR